MTGEEMLNQRIYSSFGFLLALSGSELGEPAGLVRPQTRDSGIASEPFQFIAVGPSFRHHAKAPCSKSRVFLPRVNRWTARLVLCFSDALIHSQ